MFNPSARAVFMLITSSKRSGRSIGRSPGFAPLRMRSTYDATRLYLSEQIGAVGHQATVGDLLAPLVDGRQAMRFGQLDDLSPIAHEVLVRPDHQRRGALAHQCGKRSRVVAIAYGHDRQRDAERLRGLACLLVVWRID